MPSGSGSSRRNDWRANVLDILLPITRILGVFTGIVLLGVGVDLTFHHRPSGIYILLSSFLVLWLEVLWAMTLFLQLCARNGEEESPRWRCWRGWCWLVAGWRRFLLYVCLAVVPARWPGRLWLSHVAAAQLLLLALLHLFIAICGGEETCSRSHRRRRTLLQSGGNEQDSCDSSRFEEISDVLDDRIPVPMPSGTHHLLNDSRDKPSPILEI